MKHVTGCPYPKRFGVIGFFAGQMQIRVRHTDKELASQTVNYLLRNKIPHTIQFCHNGAEIIELLGDSSILARLKAITIKKQIVRLENKLNELQNF
jgi:hypothetical protein